MSSTRLPGKVMADLVGAPMILRQIERLARCEGIDQIVVATSDRDDDAPLAQALEAAGQSVFRGSLEDVLGRFSGALAVYGPADHLVRLTADCPLADPALIDATLALHLARGADYSANTPAKRMFPKGLDIEVMRAPLLRQAARDADTPYEREHVTPHFYRHPERFDLAFLTQEADEEDVRWTVDRPDDLAFVRAVYEGLYADSPAFTSDDIRAFVTGRPDLRMFGGDRRV